MKILIIKPESIDDYFNEDNWVDYSDMCYLMSGLAKHEEPGLPGNSDLENEARSNLMNEVI